MSLPGPWDVTAKWFMLVESAKLGIRAEFHIQADLVVKLGIKGSGHVAYYLSSHFKTFQYIPAQSSFTNILSLCSFRHQTKSI